jgi:hypothetical protein
VVGDWTGSGCTGIGVVDPSTMTWYLRNEDGPGLADAGIFQFGAPGWIPVVGHWAVRTSPFGAFPLNTGIAAFDPSTATWYLSNEVSAGAPDAGMKQFGGPGWLPVGDGWIGASTSVPVVVDPGSMTWYMNSSTPAFGFQYGAGWRPVMGDWTGDGAASPGVIDPGGVWHLSDFVGLAPFAFGLGSWVPLVGHWLPGAIAAGSPRVGSVRAAPGSVDGALRSLSETLAAPASGTTTTPLPSDSASLSAADVPAPAGEQAVRPWGSAPPSGTLSVRHAYLTGRTRTTALDQLFTTGFE